jgi:D-alanine-D-alanine ligase
MTRIGFAFNQKPRAADPRVEDDAESGRADEEPPSRDAGCGRREATGSWGRDPDPEPASRPHPASRIPHPEDQFAEWDSEETIAAVERALGGLGEVIRLEATADFPERLRAERPDIVFNMAEGLRGANRESHVPAICEFFGVPYSGSDPFTLSLCLDKARTKECLAFHGVPTAPFALVRCADELRDAGCGLRDAGNGLGDAGRLAPSWSHPASRVPLPCFIKPAYEGSSKGITERNFCRTAEELEERVEELLERYAQPVLVESYLPGAEFTCAVLGNGARARVLPLVGMNFSALPPGALPVYGFEAKWLWDRPERPLEIFECPARIDEALRSRIEAVVLRAYHVLGCRDWSRIDVRLDAAGVPNVVEVNPLPGILPNPEDNSCFPKAARAAGMSYDQLIQACVRFAAERQGVPLPEETVHAHSVNTGCSGLAPDGALAGAHRRVTATLG